MVPPRFNIECKKSRYQKDVTPAHLSEDLVNAFAPGEATGRAQSDVFKVARTKRGGGNARGVLCDVAVGEAGPADVCRHRVDRAVELDCLVRRAEARIGVDRGKVPRRAFLFLPHIVESFGTIHT